MAKETRTDSNELTESLEDYLEVIWNVINERKAVRPKDIVEKMEVRGASVTGALRALAKRGLIFYAPYDEISLTPEGAVLAKDVVRRHEDLRKFLTHVLGVDAKTADAEACRMEHAISRPVLDRLLKLLAFLDGCPRALKTTLAEVVGSGAPDVDCGHCEQTRALSALQSKGSA